jgi:glycosyltransferase involved in cell wall biosynthesis
MTRPVVAIGPEMPGWGSWDWIGEALCAALADSCEVVRFTAWDCSQADVVILVKHRPPRSWVEAVRRGSKLVFCPVDVYDSAAAIVADADWLQCCSRIVVHARRLIRHLTAYAATEYLDHPLKYATPTRQAYRPEGRLLWVGVRSNLPALVDWVNTHPLPGPLDVLTNPERAGVVPPAETFGFRAGLDVTIREWTPARHLDLSRTARAALDIKSEDFRGQHKPPAKALDFVASGLPLALEAGSGAAEHLASLGLSVPSPLETGRWLSQAYWQEVRRVGEQLWRTHSAERVATQCRGLIEAILAEARLTEPSVAGRSQPVADPQVRYQAALGLASRGEHTAAAEALSALDADGTPSSLRALVRNDLAVLAALSGDRSGAGFRLALELDPDCAPARLNLLALEASSFAGDPENGQPMPGHRPTRVAVLSLLFNWPSTGGGNVHSAELTHFLAEAGYEVRHFYARYERWGLGRVTEATPFPAEAIPFTDEQWTAAGVVERFRQAVDGFDPDWVVLTDSWNMKPVMAAAAGGRAYVLRLQALECLCPLNNVRLLPAPGGKVRQCTRHQLATPDECNRCLRERGPMSGDLHRAERAMAGVGTPEYRQTLERAFAGAAAVLAVNPLTAAMVEPHAADVRVVTAGMDPGRFPWPFPVERRAAPTPGRLRLLFAGLTGEWMKGFHILSTACALLWHKRQDFELVVTDDPPETGACGPWARYVGWQSQTLLPGQMAGADVVVVPTVAQEALGRTAVEAMAAGKPVVASRLGGLPFTVPDGAAGLLCDPGDPQDLAAKLAMLLDDPALRERLGRFGRQRFEEHYAWPAIVARHYLPLFGPPIRPEVPPVLVVIAHNAARPTDPLVALLDSMAEHSAGRRYEVLLVVNRDGAETVDLPLRHSFIDLLYRVNTGYEIGAWEAGWRAGPVFGGYLFLQSECRVVRAGWLTAFARVASALEVGLVGECLSPDWDAPWPVLAERFRGQQRSDGSTFGGRSAERVEYYLHVLGQQGIPPGERGDHLQSLVLYATRTVLERIGGFPSVAGKDEAVAAEIGISKKVQAVGLTLAQVDRLPFEYVEHSQWLHRRPGR